MNKSAVVLLTGIAGSGKTTLIGKLNEKNEAVRVGGVKYTIKDGIVFDSKLLLKDVKEMVRRSKDDIKYEIYQPGNKKDFMKSSNITKD